MAVTIENGTITFSNLLSKNIESGEFGVIAESVCAETEPFASSNARGDIAERSIQYWMDSAASEGAMVAKFLSAK